MLISVVLLVLAVVIAVGGTAAIYTSQVFQRSVVRNRDTEAIRFSSDKLYRVAQGTPLQKYFYPMSQNQTTMSFIICNYDQGKNTIVSEKDIDYTVKFSLPDGTNVFDYTVNSTSAVSGSLTINGSLKGAKRSADTYTIDFGDNAYADTQISVTVVPTDLSLTKNTVLQGTLIPIEYATAQGVNVSYDFTDSTRPNGTPDKFDAYNLSVSITGGEGDVVISWDASQLDIDPFFKEKGTIGTGENGYTTLTVHMNSENATGNYLIQFYNHNEIKPSWTSWNELPIRVSLSTE